MQENYEDLLWVDDAIVLEQNSRDFRERVIKSNYKTEVLASFLQSHPRGMFMNLFIINLVS
jgi:cystathionine beta-lyase/cystathionine gamma-synthase